MAQDKGFPPLSRTVEVQIDVVDRANNPPVWDHTVYGPIYIRENLPVGAKVVSVKARCVGISVGLRGHSTQPRHKHVTSRHDTPPPRRPTRLLSAWNIHHLISFILASMNYYWFIFICKFAFFSLRRNGYEKRLCVLFPFR